MRTSALDLFAATSLAALSCLLSARSPVQDPGPQFDAEGRLLPPKDYRSFVFLTSGFAMSYGPAAVAAAAGGVDFPLVHGKLQEPASPLPKTAGCNACHSKHGAVEQTFTQFYPTLFEVARAKGTVRKDFVGMPPDNRELEHRLSTADGDRCAALLDEVRTQWPLATVLRESSLNQLGYRLHAGKHQAAAIAVLRTAAQSFPGSANAWDSLSEVLEAAGDRAQAREAVERGLQALPGDQKIGASMREQLDRSLRDRKQRLQ